MKPVYTLLKKPFFGRYQVDWNWPHSIARDDWRECVIESRSGGKLAAILGEAETSPRGAVVLAHPMGRAAKAHWLKNGLANALRDRGFHVLAFDFNGFGASEQGNFHYPLDVLAAGETLRDCYPNLPLGVHGASFGAAWALCACAKEVHPFEWAVLENPFTTLAEFWTRFKFANLVLKSISALRPSLERALNPEIQAGQLHSLRSLQLHFGSDDDVTPPAMGGRLIAQSRRAGIAEARLEIWPETGHNGLFMRWADEYLDSWLTAAVR